MVLGDMLSIPFKFFLQAQSGDEGKRDRLGWARVDGGMCAAKSCNGNHIRKTLLEKVALNHSPHPYQHQLTRWHNQMPSADGKEKIHTLPVGAADPCPHDLRDLQLETIWKTELVRSSSLTVQMRKQSWRGSGSPNITQLVQA